MDSMIFERHVRHIREIRVRAFAMDTDFVRAIFPQYKEGLRIAKMGMTEFVVMILRTVSAIGFTESR